jgi:hypothetical protein
MRGLDLRSHASNALGGLLSVALSAGRPAWELPSILPFGARTFLGPRAHRTKTAAARPTAPTIIAPQFSSAGPRAGSRRPVRRNSRLGARLWRLKPKPR